MIPGDVPLVCFDAFAREVQRLRPELGKSQVYALAREVERRQSDPLDPLRFCVPVNVGGDQQAATMTSSFQNCIVNQLPDEQAQRRKAHDWKMLGAKGGRPKKG